MRKQSRGEACQQQSDESAGIRVPLWACKAGAQYYPRPDVRSNPAGRPVTRCAPGAQYYPGVTVRRTVLNCAPAFHNTDTRGES
jgi:hypothetical protein